MKSFFLTLLFILFPVADSFSQVYSTQYRPPNQNWQELKSERFRVIYPEKFHDIAVRTLSILELEYNDIQELVGGELTDFPVILNPENDRGNGFVSPFNFRSEIEIAPLKGKALNPRSGQWMESVAPHELVHALHFSGVSPNSISGLLRIFSPDMSRSLHAGAPLGFLEGIAVEHESNNPMHESGRGNYPYFYNQFNAMLNTDDEWSMGQLVHISTYTTPFNRHYVGGYEFVDWLQETYGSETMREAIAFHHRFPFLGFGIALRHATGQFPGSLYKDFQEYHQNKQISETTGGTDAASFEIPFKATCKKTSRPIWLDNETLLFHGRSCNKETGFYTYNFSSDKTELLYEVSITGDNNYQLSSDGNSLLYSRYHVDLLYDNIFRSDIHELNLQAGTSTRLTKQKRVTSPQRFNDQLFSIQTEGQHQKLVELKDGEVVKSYSMTENSSVIEISFHPNQSGLMAILGRKNGVQAIWFEDINEIDMLFEQDPDIVFTDGSVFDPVWHISENRLLFTSDYTGVMNVYEYDGDRRQINQKTESLYNAFEPSYSTDGQSIAYIGQVKHEQLPFTLSNADAINQELDSTNWTINNQILSQINRPLLNRSEEVDDSLWEQGKYTTSLGWLKPRFWLPTIRQNVNTVDEVGLRLESADRMSRHSYIFDVSHFAKDFWYDLTYRYKGFYPGFEFSIFNSPNYLNIALDVDDERVIIPTISQQRGFSLSIPFQFRLEQNTRFSSVFIEPEYILTQRSFRNPNDATQSYSDFRTLHTLGFNTTFNIGLRQFRRDVQPNSGFRFFTQTRYGLNEPGFTLSVPQGDFDAGFAKRQGFRGGATTYIAPLKRWNQSLKITVQGITQTDAPVFNNQSLYSDHFETSAFAGVSNIGIIDTRYTIPLTYPDDGGLLVPVYLSNIYLVGFTQTIGDISGFDGNRFNQTARTIIGGGIRSRFRLSNLSFDVGVSIGWEPGTNNVSYVFGAF